MANKILLRASRHKFITTIIVMVLLAAGYIAYGAFTKPSTALRYVLAAVQKGTIMTTVTGTGQVSASNQVDLKPKASGDIISLPIQAGQTVKAGTVIAQLDSKDAQKAVRDAQANLESAQIALQKLQQPANALSITQAANTLARAQDSKQSAQDDLQKAFDDGFNTVSNAFLDLPTIMTGLNTILFTNTPGLGTSGQWNIDYYTQSVVIIDPSASIYEADVMDKMKIARTAYDKNFSDYKTTDRSANISVIELLINETYATTKAISDVVKSANNLIQFYEDKMTAQGLKYAPLADTHVSTLNTYTGQVNGHLSGLSSTKNTIQSDRQTITNSDRTIDENTGSLAQLNAGADPLDIASSRLSLQQRQNALRDAQETLSNYTVRVPFDGVIAAVNSKKFDPVSSGTVIAILTTQQQIATISLNEVDVSKIKVGEKVTLIFDAISGLSITGAVADIETIGTVSQGVVTYNVTISFDTQDDRVKPGMSVSADIITNVKQDVLMAPNGAIKTQGNTQYVEMLGADIRDTSSLGVLSPASPTQQTVEVGIANDTSTEITSGLKEGDLIIVRTISATSKTNTNQAPSLFGGGARRFGG